MGATYKVTTCNSSYIHTPTLSITPPRNQIQFDLIFTDNSIKDLNNLEALRAEQKEHFRPKHRDPLEILEGDEAKEAKRKIKRAKPDSKMLEKREAEELLRLKREEQR